MSVGTLWYEHVKEAHPDLDQSTKNTLYYNPQTALPVVDDVFGSVEVPSWPRFYKKIGVGVSVIAHAKVGLHGNDSGWPTEKA